VESNHRFRSIGPLAFQADDEGSIPLTRSSLHLPPEMSGSPSRSLSMTASRRLQLAAEGSGAIGVFFLPTWSTDRVRRTLGSAAPPANGRDGDIAVELSRKRKLKLKEWDHCVMKVPALFSACVDCALD
jgi:hypothetical protein